ncbi:MAG: hypothetical protein U9N83_03495, partial [Thermodesulfobacteriota bacterium]|nr:hypothetical protein [Thermodesulfobacteriota bacterium]
ALDHRHPLVSCLINGGWDEGRMANILIVREAPTGLVLSAFLVDLAGLGLKDTWGNYGLSKADIQKTKSKAAASGIHMIPCDLSLASSIVYGGVAWAKKWRFKLPPEYKIWLRLLEPVDQKEIDPELFGENGRPFLILDEDELDIFDDEVFDHQILQTNLETEKDGLSRKTLTRIGDIKAALINFSRRSEFREEFEAALKKQFGKPQRPDSEDEWITFQDWFTLEYELEDGETIPRRFVEHYQDLMSDDVRRLILGWENVIKGIFEIKARTKNSLRMKNLVNEREYKVFPTASMDNFKVKPGAFMVARIVPSKGFHVFSGGAMTIGSEENEEQRASVYRSAIDMQMKNPRLAFKDNEEKLRKSLKSVRKHYEDFANYFGTDEIFGTGKEILPKYQEFFNYLVFEKKGPKNSQPAALSYEKSTGETYQLPKMDLPESVLQSKDVGMLCDPVEGISFLIDYRQFIDVFRYPEQHLGKEETEDLVLGYLESDSISDVPFRRVARKFPHNFNKVISYYRDQESCFSDHIDDLMMEFKPETFDKLPGIVAVLDSEMSRLSRMAKE